jgi:hypothetical protein
MGPWDGGEGWGDGSAPASPRAWQQAPRFADLTVGSYDEFHEIEGPGEAQLRAALSEFDDCLFGFRGPHGQEQEGAASTRCVLGSPGCQSKQRR